RYELIVTGATINQGPPTSGSATAGGSGIFSANLLASTGFSGPVTFLTSTPGFTVTSGAELTNTGSLSVAASPYTISGSDSDAFGDAGTWTYSLTVNAGTSGGAGATTLLVQTSPTAGTVSSASSGTFSVGPLTVENNSGAVTFVTTKSSSSLTVSTKGLISSTGTLSAGSYSVSGTDSDASGNSGTWIYTLTVTAAPITTTVTFEANGGTGTMVPETESAPTALSLNGFSRPHHTFIDWNTSANGSGVSYANGAQYSFAVSTKLYAQWTVGRAPSHTITFASNGGRGTTASEIHNTPTAVSSNRFSRSGYRFVDWNAAANGSGASYAAGATYSFKKSILLYAQWKMTKQVAPPVLQRVVNFAANGGGGKMPSERESKPTSLTPNHFTRAGYAFVRWSTRANGSGASYANGATYAFGASTNLYAQWKKKV
ncbi:MAG: InlB B-repeat-containing protein, partial [Nitrososphaerales archaeon]